jgi:hypothetical protein
MADNKIMSGLSGLAQPINPTNLTADNLAEYQKTLKDAMDSLEQRYAQPNWFNVAAGFAKPQLGGFTASLGSAAQALGENVEKQRESQIPIAAMKVEMGRVGMIQKQKNDADKLLQAQDPTKPIPAVVMGQLAKLDPDAAAAAKAKNEELTRLAQEKQTTVSTTGTALSNQSYMSQNPWLKGIDDEISGIAKKSPEEATAVVTKLDKSRPMSIDPITWGALNPDDKLEKINTYAGAQAKLGLDEEAKAREQAQGANSILPHLQELRGLVTGEGPDDPKSLVGVLGQFQGNTLFDLIAREVNKNGLTNGGIGKDLEASLANLKATPDQINRLQVLIKGLATMQADKRDSANNPTNLYQYLQQQGSPTISNTGNAMVRMFDMAAAGARRDKDAYASRIQSGVDARHMDTPAGDIEKITNRYSSLRKQLALADPTNAMPSFYTSPTFLTDKAPVAPTTGTNVAPSAGPKEGETSVSKSGKPIVYKNGRWEYT